MRWNGGMVKTLALKEASHEKGVFNEIPKQCKHTWTIILEYRVNYEDDRCDSLIHSRNMYWTPAVCPDPWEHNSPKMARLMVLGSFSFSNVTKILKAIHLGKKYQIFGLEAIADSTRVSHCLSSAFSACVLASFGWGPRSRGPCTWAPVSLPAELPPPPPPRAQRAAPMFFFKACAGFYPRWPSIHVPGTPPSHSESPLSCLKCEFCILRHLWATQNLESLMGYWRGRQRVLVKGSSGWRQRKYRIACSIWIFR